MSNNIPSFGVGTFRLTGQTVIDSVRATAAGGDSGSAVYEREIRSLRANAQDQAGEIARLKAALATFEQQGQAGGLKDSKIALKARLGSAQAQADQQAATIAKLRAELAATHERLARQAAHFMGEMRRIGTVDCRKSACPNRWGSRGCCKRVSCCGSVHSSLRCGTACCGSRGTATRQAVRVRRRRLPSWRPTRPASKQI